MNQLPSENQPGEVTDQSSLTERLARLEQQANEHLAGWQRAKADYLNLKRQSEQEKQAIAQFAQAGAVVQFLPVYDNLKRAEQHIPDDQRSLDWVKGIIHIQKQFEDVLKQMNIIPIAALGQPFDPAKHHAVRKVKRDGVHSGTIVEEIKSGFMVDDKVLEPAQVTVAE